MDAGVVNLLPRPGDIRPRLRSVDSASKGRLVEGFHEYVELLERIAQGLHVLNPTEMRERLALCLNGEPWEILRRTDAPRIREQSAYFTSAKLASRLAARVPIDEGIRRLYFDPACGAGDLLLAVAKRLPIADTLTATLIDWGHCLAGYDISNDFVRATKARLLLLAAKRCRVRPDTREIIFQDVFPKIVERDYLSGSKCTYSPDAVVMNPPYSYTDAPRDCRWARGRVTAAAVFTESAIQRARKGATIAAILPDVLRSGTRYQGWRCIINTMGTIRQERPLGIFDRWADVDVYLFDFQKAAISQGNCPIPQSFSVSRSGGVGKRFAVHVGPVVPHRHEQTGTDVRYIRARSLPAWGEHRAVTEKRGFTGRLFEPPFVVVRRTSRPDQAKRAVATLILGDGPVAVENHLIVMLPNNGTIQSCRDLVLRLRSQKTDKWINRVLRCRHLTTRVLAELPWWRTL